MVGNPEVILAPLGGWSLGRVVGLPDMCPYTVGHRYTFGLDDPPRCA